MQWAFALTLSDLILDPMVVLSSVCTTMEIRFGMRIRLDLARSVDTFVILVDFLRAHCG